ncbi:MAG: YkvS family protein [Bacilli bacterium]
MKIAQAGNIIEFKDGIQGIVQKVNKNSVIVDITCSNNFNDLDMEPLTVVNHKNYQIIKEAIQ